MTTTFPTHDPTEWRRRVEGEIGPDRDFERALVARTLEGLAIAPLYTPEDVPASAAGTAATSPRGGGWTIAQRVDDASAVAANARLLEDLENGATGVAIELSRTAHGLASEDEQQGGVDVRSITDLDALLGDVYLDAIPIAFGTNANGLPLAATLVALCGERDVDPARVQAHLGMDPIAALAADGALPGDMDDARRELHELVEHSRAHLDGARSLAVDAGVWHRAGGHAVLELGYALAGFVETLRWLEEKGLPPSAAHSEFVWRMDVGQDVLDGIAKLRAARALHARVLGSAGVERATPLVLHATTSERALARRDPWTNMLRGTLGTIAATVGGADLVTTLPFDAEREFSGAQSGSSALGRRNARNTQLVLERESRLDHVGDPARGAYAIEARTDALARAAWDLMRDLERGGGLLAALRSGRIMDELGAARDALRSDLAKRKRSVVGVSAFPAPQDLDGPADSAAAPQRAEPSAARGSVVVGSIDSFGHAVEAAAAGATLEALGSALVRGAPESVDPLPRFREASVFEDLAEAADRMDRRPKVFLACVGPLAAHGARATFATHLFHAGGLDVEQSAPDLDADALASAFSASGAPFACLCATDDGYAEHAQELCRALDAAGARSILIARKAASDDDALRAAGLAGYVHLGCDAEAVLRGLLELEGAVLGAEEVVL
ncbi:MAG: methylmalonyl-CoA mutase family protein [Planctomycetota bacterium]